MKHYHAIVAGTFDHLHKGHKKILTTALQSTQQLSCGLTQTNLTRNKPLSSLIQSFKHRHHHLSNFLTSQSKYWSIFPLHHPLGSAPASNQYDAIITSPETLPNVNRINQLRQQNHLPPLKPIIINLIKSSDNQPLSSTRIRQGRINRQGFAYHQIFPSTKTLHLPPAHRFHFRRPFATLLSGSQNQLNWAGLKAKKILTRQPPLLTIAVGDIAVISLLQQNLPLNLAIVDLKTKRQPLFSSLDKLGLHPDPHHTATNPSSSLTPSLIQALKSSLTPSLQPHTIHQTILVKGEEDLAVLPAILLSPLNTAIFYGQPNQGLVHIRVTEKSKQKALHLLKKFT
jgi:phosphopantetheine adenylyltransferase/uncharacterized protein (UPF0218 family)